tara:strand:- start:302 stop:1738 length:1437 start_codon:yes stop_codon:yes gene_type:complete
MIDQKILNFNAPIIVVGDIILDKYWFGDIARISPEAPVPVLNFTEASTKPGGAANVANNIANLGAEVFLFGAIGNDPDGDQLESDLSKMNIKCEFLKSNDFQTISKLRVLNKPNQIVRIDFEKENQTIDHHLIENRIKSKIDQSSIVVMSDYAKGLLSKEFIKTIIEEANAKNKIVLVDPKSDDFDRYKGATMLTPNKKEFENVVGRCVSDKEIVSKGEQLRQELSLQYLLVTLGAKGMVLILKNNVAWFPSKARKVFDVTGAGDTVISFIAAMLSAGLEIKKTVSIANDAAGIAVGKIGTAKVNMNELSDTFQYGTSKKIFGHHNTLKKIIDEQKSDGKKIVMTNGCFDLLHPGHISYLEKAKSFGDILIVAINSDASVSKLKGTGRPINTLSDREIILSSLSMVDYVISFDSLSPLKLYKEILPDVLVKGGDYKLDEIEGAKEIIESGGEVNIVDFIDGYSSSSIIKKITGGSQNS